MVCDSTKQSSETLTSEVVAALSMMMYRLAQSDYSEKYAHCHTIPVNASFLTGWVILLGKRDLRLMFRAGSRLQHSSRCIRPGDSDALGWPRPHPPAVSAIGPSWVEADLRRLSLNQMDSKHSCWDHSLRTSWPNGIHFTRHSSGRAPDDSC